jgi:hypothetical protein
MKTLSLLLLLLSALRAPATLLALFTVKMPLYLHGSDTDPLITITDVPFASAHSIAEAPYSALTTPFIPPSDGSWKTPEDINLASRYGIKVTYGETRPDETTLVKITIDATAAKVPEGYPFSITQVTDAVLTCVKLMTPARPESEQKITITVLPAAGKAEPSPQ